MLDFTSSLYLGLRHASCSLPGWQGLTLGKPAALQEPPGAPQVERELAALTGCEEALLAPSTLHLFLDLFTVLPKPGMAIFLDRSSYPIARWGAQQAAASGVPVRVFGWHDPEALRESLMRAPGLQPVIVTGGLCPARGRPAPIGAYAQLAAEHRGWLVVDDTQALGILGTPDGRVPYGRGGGGSLRRAALRSKETVVVNSLAKAFGVPVAMLGGNAAFMANFRRRSLTRMHCSPPSAAVISAAGRAVEINRRLGDRLRWSLAMAVCRLRRGLDRLGVLANRSLFPVQPLRLFDGIEAAALHAALIERGVRTVLQRSPTARAARLSFILTARHGPEIDQAVESVADALRRGTSGQTKGVRGNYESAQFRGGALWGVRRVAGREF